MEKLFTVELTHEEWIEVMIAMNSLAYSRTIYERDDKKYKQAKEIKENIQNQISQEVSVKEKSH